MRVAWVTWVQELRPLAGSGLGGSGKCRSVDRQDTIQGMSALHGCLPLARCALALLLWSGVAVAQQPTPEPDSPPLSPPPLETVQEPASAPAVPVEPPAPRAVETPPRSEAAPVERTEPVRAPSEVRLGLGSSTGIGAAYHLVSAEDVPRLGLALQGSGFLRLAESLSLRLNLDWALAHFDRALGAIALGISVAQWTTGAYRSVGRWLVTGDPAWFLFKFMASIFAFTALSLGYMAAGVLFVLTPVLATSFIQAGLTAGLHFVYQGLDLFVEAGVGSMLYAERQLGAGWGPMVGWGLRFGFAQVGAHLLWSPPELNDRRESHVYGAALTVSLVR